ncbi:MAG: LPS assembly protein LptD [Gammaproteobacteria bacterium]|nr:LPS assembly protein LptD [Gammaproteobacteria bacterium]
MRKLSVLSSLLSSVLLTAVSHNALAAETTETDLWDMCTDSASVFNIQPVLPRFATPKQLDISAKSIRSVKDGTSVFEDDVLIEKEQFRLKTGKLTYDQNKAIISLPQASHIESKNLIFDSQTGEINNDTDVSWFSHVSFVIQSSHIQGVAPEIKVFADDSTFLSQVSFSSCEPGKEAWTFSARNLELDHNDESGAAHHVVVKVKDVPIFYLPYISFPLGERRRSGILSPEFRFGSSRNGDEISLPYYWNIATNQDATFTPVYLQKRGTQLLTNYRYLTKSSSGELDLEYLANDRQAENNLAIDETRYLSKFIHKTNFTDNLSFNVNLAAASDSAYLSDFGQSLSITSTTHLQQAADFQYRRGQWQTRLLAQYFQTTDDNIALADTPYRRQPQLTVSGTEPINNAGLAFNIAAEWVDFRHRCDGIQLECPSKIHGQRTDLSPQLSWPASGSYWFFTPTIGQRFTAYQMTEADIPRQIEDRNLTVVQFDSGLFFERRFAQNYTQTLEPRLYYLHVPAADQSAIPLFDTSATTFSFSQLFRDNRFNGADRVADANQLSTALTSRIINDESGNERFSASIGQIHYFDDREVSLDEPADNSDIQTETSSDIAAELVLRNNNWSYRLSALQNTQSNEVDQGSFLYHYQTDNRHIFNLGYRYKRDLNLADSVDDQIDQSDLSFKLPVSDHWSALGRWNYSLNDERDLESIFGFEYNSCCWAFRIISRGHIVQDANNQSVFDRSILFSLVLKGFGSTGKANQELERAILGFHPEY